ncbi:MULTISPECIES: GNAT family N-acetyltransferase [unclassified Paenibacillus]|nr:GNAT family N-acetyltransferase [Paenibacillus sp. FSL H8-237]
MRQRVGMYPSFFYKPVEWEREQYAENKDNMFVMIVDETIVAVGKIAGNKISMVAISIEHQSRGYGRSFVKFLINEIISRGEDKAILEVVKGNFAKA